MSSTVNFEGPWIYRGIILSIVDADTFRVRIDAGFSWWHEESLRLIGFDAPESRGKDKKKGELANALVDNLLLDTNLYLKTVKIQTFKKSFDRYLAKISYFDDKGNECDLNQYIYQALKEAKLLKPGSKWNPVVPAEEVS